MGRQLVIDMHEMPRVFALRHSQYPVCCCACAHMENPPFALGQKSFAGTVPSIAMDARRPNATTATFMPAPLLADIIGAGCRIVHRRQRASDSPGVTPP
jgi:hypothetical protein